MFAGSAAAAVVLAVVAELAGTQRQPAVNLAAGCALALGGLVVLLAGTAWLAGVLLVVAAATRYAATAGIADGVAFLHRAFLVHALVVVTAAASVSRTARSAALRAGRWLIVGLAYVAAVDRDLAQATPWTLAVGLGAIVVTVAAGVAHRWPWLLVVAASAGTATWALAASVARTNGWFDISTLLQLYVGGLVAVVVSIAAWAWYARRAASLSSGDLLRDDGRGGVRLAFRGEHGEFEDIAGERFAAAPGESTVLVDLGGDLGEVLLAHGSPGLETRQFRDVPLDDRMTDGLRLVASNRRAAQTLRSQASEVAASAQRLRIADELVAAQLSSELERMVVPRIERAVEELDGDPSDVAAQARVSLALVVDEIEGLAAGLVPVALDGGLCAALATIADQEMVSVRCDVDDSTIDPVDRADPVLRRDRVRHQCPAPRRAIAGRSRPARRRTACRHGRVDGHGRWPWRRRGACRRERWARRASFTRRRSERHRRGGHAVGRRNGRDRPPPTPGSIRRCAHSTLTRCETHIIADSHWCHRSSGSSMGNTSTAMPSDVSHQVTVTLPAHPPENTSRPRSSMVYGASP